MESVAADRTVGEFSQNHPVLHRLLQNMDPEAVSNDPLLRRLLQNRNVLLNRDLTVLNDPFARRLLQQRMDPETIATINNRPLGRIYQPDQQIYPATALPHQAQPPSNMPFNYRSSEGYYYPLQDMSPPPLPYHPPVEYVDQSSDHENTRSVRHRRGRFEHHSIMARFNQHSDYEHLLLLQQQIGYVNVGLSEETISNNLKTSLIGAACEAEEEEEEGDVCAVCLDEYKVNETIGTLQCGHRYHADCIRGWLLCKNVCPMCKATALAI